MPSADYPLAHSCDPDTCFTETRGIVGKHTVYAPVQLRACQLDIVYRKTVETEAGAGYRQQLTTAD